MEKKSLTLLLYFQQNRMTLNLQSAGSLDSLCRRRTSSLYRPLLPLEIIGKNVTLARNLKS